MTVGICCSGPKSLAGDPCGTACRVDRRAAGRPRVCYGEATVVLSPLAVTVKAPHGFDE